MEESGQRPQAVELARLVSERARDLTIGEKIQGASIADKAARENPPDAVLATAYALELLDLVEPESALAPRLYEGLLALRKGIHWGTTEATSAAAIALAGHAAREAKAAAEAEVAIELNGEALKTLRIAPARPGDETQAVEVPEAKLKPGDNQVVLKKSGSGRFGYTVSYDFVEPAEKITEEGNLLKVRRQYLAYVPPRPEPHSLAPCAPAFKAAAISRSRSGEETSIARSRP